MRPTIKRGFGGLKMGHFTLIEGRLLKLGALQLQVLQLALGKRCVFNQCDLQESDFSATALQSSQFMRCQMSRSRFSGEKHQPVALHSVQRGVPQIDMVKGGQQTAALRKAFNQCDLQESDFSATALQSSQFMRCQMSRSRFSGYCIPSNAVSRKSIW
jgi:uncharacterized protein YjbI with pentapeptide repeats